MPDEEKIDDFMSLWKKKQENSSKPSAIGETLDKLKVAEKNAEALRTENVELKQKIKQNIELLNKTENIIKEGIEERKRLEREKNQIIADVEIELSNLREQNTLLRNENDNLKSILENFKDEIATKELQFEAKLDVIKKAMGSNNSFQQIGANEELEAEFNNLKHKISAKNVLISDLENQIENLKTDAKIRAQQVYSETEHSEKDTRIQLLEQKINEQEKKIEELAQKNIELLEQSVASNGSSSSEIKDSKTLDILCQDLQSQLNKHKSLVQELKKQNSDLKQQLENLGQGVDFGTLKVMKEEDKDLMKKSRKFSKKGKNTQSDADEIERLRIQSEEKENEISLLKGGVSSSGSGIPDGLVDDLQKKLNKYKMIIKELKEENSRLKS